MEDDKKTVQDLNQIITEQTFAAGDAWLRSHGILSKVAHNSIVANLYVRFPQVVYLDYFLPEDTSRKKVWVRLYMPLWKLLFTNKDKMIDEVILFLREYLRDYDIKVELKRYKKEARKSDEIPQDAMDHVADAAGVQPEPVQPATAEASPTPPGPDASSGSEAGGDDRAGAEAAPADAAGPKSGSDS